MPSSMRRVITNPAGSIASVNSRVRAVCAHTPLRDTRRVCLVDRVETKLPHPVKGAQIPHVQHERPVGFEDRDGPARASPKRDLVTNGEVLKLREDAGCTGTIQIADEAVEPVVAVEATALVADLHQPGPDVFWRRVDDDDRRSRVRRVDEEAVARHDARQIGCRGAPPAHPSSDRKPIQDRDRENHEECGKHGIPLRSGAQVATPRTARWPRLDRRAVASVGNQ